MVQICEPAASASAEAFYLSDALWDRLNGARAQDCLPDLVSVYHRALSTGANTGQLYRHCEELGLNDSVPLDAWFRRGFAGILHGRALEKVWDKVVGGSLKILPFVAVAKAEAYKNAILACQSIQQAVACLETVSAGRSCRRGSTGRCHDR